MIKPWLVNILVEKLDTATMENNIGVFLIPVFAENKHSALGIGITTVEKHRPGHSITYKSVTEVDASTLLMGIGYLLQNGSNQDAESLGISLDKEKFSKNIQAYYDKHVTKVD